MLLKNRNNLTNTLVFRLTVWFVLLFTFLLSGAFWVSYKILMANLLTRIDTSLNVEVREIEEEFYDKGIDQIQEEIDLEMVEEGIGRVFVRLLSMDGKTVITSDLSSWGYLDLRQLDRYIESAVPGIPVYHSVGSETSEEKCRIISKIIDDGKYALQFGMTLKDNQVLADKYKRIFVYAFLFMLVSGGVLGWFISRQAMAGIRKITDTALRIGNDGFKHRVETRDEREEVKQLAVAFNNMLDRIEDLIREISDVTDNLAHDLRTPITRIRGFAETTLNGEQNLEIYKEGYHIVVEECDRLVKLINTMLEIKQSDAGIKDFQTTRLDLVELVGKGYEIFLPLAEDKKIDFGFHRPPSPVYIQGDEAKLQRVVSNLLDNAIKFTDPHGKILISVIQENEEGRISIKDTGIGMPDDQIGRIFEKFYRIDSSRSTTGNGLGLSWVKSIVTSMGWSIQVTSSPGKGSEFVIKIPLEMPNV